MENSCVVLMDLTQYGGDPDVAANIERYCKVMRFGAEVADRDISAVNPVAICAELDYPDITRLAALSALKRRQPQIPILMFTEQHSEALAVWALRSRMWNYFVKPLDRDLVLESLEILNHARHEGRREAMTSMLMPSVSLPRESRFRDAGEERRAALQVARNYIDAHLSERISVDDVASSCGLGAGQLAREFKSAHGVTISGYLLKRRVQLACELLRNRSAAVNDIGWTVGIRDPSHFTRTFRSYVGVSPSEYRSLWQEQHAPGARVLARQTSTRQASKSSNEVSKLS